MVGWPTPLKNMTSSNGMMTFPRYGKIKNVPNHQPVMTWTASLCANVFSNTLWNVGMLKKHGEHLTWICLRGPPKKTKHIHYRFPKWWIFHWENKKVTVNNPRIMLMWKKTHVKCWHVEKSGEVVVSQLYPNYVPMMSPQKPSIYLPKWNSKYLI